MEPTDCYNPVKWQKSDTNGTDLSEHPDMEVRGKVCLQFFFVFLVCTCAVVCACMMQQVSVYNNQ